MKSFEIRIQDSPITKLTSMKLRRWLFILDALNKFSTVWTIQVFFSFTAAFTDIIMVQARIEFACKLLIKISVTVGLVLDFKFTLFISPLTNFTKFPGTVLLSYVIKYS